MAGYAGGKLVTGPRTKWFNLHELNGPKVAPYLFIAPFFILYAAFWVFPVGYSIFLGFVHWSPQESPFVGLANYQDVLAREVVHKAFANALWYVIVNNAVQLTLAILIAVVLHDYPIAWLKNILRSAYYVPNIVSGVTAGILFIIFLGQGGLVNRLIGVEIPWFQSTEWSKPAVIITGAWQWTGYWMVMFLAGLQGIPDELYEAAALDGANGWQRFVNVTFPLIRPVTLFVLVINTIGTLQIFSEPYVLFGSGSPGGPMDSATTPVLELYKYAFVDFDLGRGAALGWLLALVIIFFTVLQMILARRRGWSE